MRIVEIIDGIITDDNVPNNSHKFLAYGIHKMTDVELSRMHLFRVKKKGFDIDTEIVSGIEMIEGEPTEKINQKYANLSELKTEKIQDKKNSLILSFKALLNDEKDNQILEDSFKITSELIGLKTAYKLEFKEYKSGINSLATVKEVLNYE